MRSIQKQTEACKKWQLQEALPKSIYLCLLSVLISPSYKKSGNVPIPGKKNIDAQKTKRRRYFTKFQPRMHIRHNSPVWTDPKVLCPFSPLCNKTPCVYDVCVRANLFYKPAICEAHQSHANFNNNK